jgi:hypothetical protein
MAVVLHPLQQRLDRLVPEVELIAVSGECIRLVDEKHAVESASHDPVCLERGKPDVLPDEPGSVDLDQLAAAKEPHRAVHLGEQPGDRRLAGAWVAEEHEMLRRCNLRHAGVLTASLDAQERDERAYLVLDRLEARQRVELGEQLVERSCGFGTSQKVELELLADLRANLLADRTQGLQRIRHVLTVPVDDGAVGPMWRANAPERRSGAR